MFKTLLHLGGMELNSKSSEIRFEKYIIEKKSIPVANYLLPLSFEKEIAYELKEVEVTRVFENDKDKIINNK